MGTGWTKGVSAADPVISEPSAAVAERVGADKFEGMGVVGSVEIGERVVAGVGTEGARIPSGVW